MHQAEFCLVDKSIGKNVITNQIWFEFHIAKTPPNITALWYRGVEEEQVCRAETPRQSQHYGIEGLKRSKFVELKPLEHHSIMVSRG